MKCAAVKENLDALLDGEIEIVSRRQIESHLENCVFCRAEFDELRAVGETVRRNLTITAPCAPPALDEKVFRAFAAFHPARISKEKPEETPPAKNGWFGTPRFAAAVFALFTLSIAASFQLGRMSVTGAEFARPAPKINAPSANAATAADVKTSVFAGDQESASAGAAPPVQIVAAPITKEKIIEKTIKIPVVQEKIIFRTVCENPRPQNAPGDERPVLKNRENQSFAVKSRLKDNQYSTQLDLEGFQAVAELKPVIIKGENNEK